MHEMYPNKTQNIQVSTIHRKSFKLRGERLNHPKPRKPRVAAMGEDSRGKPSRQASQTPLAVTFMEDAEL